MVLPPNSNNPLPKQVNNYCMKYSVFRSARVQAMENASSNAGDMLERLGLQYNKARQAKITTELCEIVSGAAAVSG